MATREDSLRRPVEDRLQRLAATPQEIARAIQDQGDVVLSRRPAPHKWSAKEVVCHLRDIEELCILRFHTMLVMDAPKVLVAGEPPQDPEAWGIGEGVPFPLDPDRWAGERQYQRNDAALALGAFRRRRQEVLTLLRRLSPAQWRRGCLHPGLGQFTFGDWTASMAAHDDKHLGQLTRAMAGSP